MTGLFQNEESFVDMYLSHTPIGELESTLLGEALAVNSTLLELSVRYKQFSEVVAAQLVDALKVNSTLTRLSLHDNRIDDAAPHSSVNSSDSTRRCFRLIWP